MTGALLKGLELMLFLKGHTYCIMRNTANGTLVIGMLSLLRFKPQIKIEGKEEANA